MAAKKIYDKKATTYTQQIALLRKHGVIISDEVKTKEYLADIGYYRLGFYIHFFEITYPKLNKQRDHTVRQNCHIEDIVALYYYDTDLRNILNKYLSRIEVAIRTTFIYKLSTKYKNNPQWFIDPNIVKSNFTSEFDRIAYNSIKKKPPIERHHKRYCGSYAPAWKTMEFMTLGNLEALYDNLIFDSDKRLISSHFGELATSAFKSYLMAVRETRNACAHGNVLIGMTLTDGIKTGMACPSFTNNEHQKFSGALRVIDYLINKISVNRAKEMWQEINAANNILYTKVPSIKPIASQLTGIMD